MCEWSSLVTFSSLFWAGCTASARRCYHLLPEQPRGGILRPSVLQIQRAGTIPASEITNANCTARLFWFNSPTTGHFPALLF